MWNAVKNKLISKQTTLMTWNAANFKLLFTTLNPNPVYNKTKTNAKFYSQNHNWKYLSMLRNKHNQKKHHQKITSTFGKRTKKMIMIFMLGCWKRNGLKEINKKCRPIN